MSRRHHPPGTQRAVCAKCGRAIWYVKVGTGGATHPTHPNKPIYKWCARRGSKPAPIDCPAGGYHRP